MADKQRFITEFDYNDKPPWIGPPFLHIRDISVHVHVILGLLCTISVSRIVSVHEEMTYSE